MIFDELINDIEKMVGLELESIKPGANIILTGVDRTAKRIELITSAGKEKTRPFSELKKIWDKLCSSPAAHVDSVLGGSGSSRNQPETIMANLPYIEWFFMDSKKHLALMKESTHDYGTLFRMDEVTAIEIKDKLSNAENTACEVVIVTEDIKVTAAAYEKVTGIPLRPVSLGVYEQYKDKVRFIIVSKSNLNDQVKAGTYTVVTGKASISTGPSIFINEREFLLFNEGGLQFLISK
ncbi:hypothetical protein [Paenibacillus sp. Aloe-11]|uniref:hypothetical protein n=1 Tax=Paenibacillus sp. Aloe-11 TaxID=1050222 RepID=UPI00024F074F|nr:hypothetical protein [Paenibacillus sp. Aloe-11]EHS59026.1 hypothetical protein WG8_0904 [Paenibacillus sp. Aloe-11]